MLGIGLVSCNSGSDSGGSTSAASSLTSSTVNVPLQTQIRTPASAYSANLAGVTANSGNNCFNLVGQANNKNYTSTINSSEYYSTATVDIVLQNSCATPQTLSALNIDVNGFTINNSPAVVNYISQVSQADNPYLALTSSQTGSNLVMDLSTPACSGSYCSWAEVPANGSYTFTINAQTNTAINSLAISSVEIDGSSPTPPVVNESGSLSVNVNTANLATICGASSNCAIGVNVLGPNGNTVESIVVNPYKNPNYTVTYNGLLIGNYTLSVNTNSYPSGSSSSISYAMNPTNGQVPVNSGTVESSSVTFSYTAPASIGNLTIKTGNVADAATFANIGVLSGAVTNTTTKVKTSFSVGVNSSTTLNNLPSGSYLITLQGLADAATGEYYTATTTTANVPSGSNTVTANLSFTSVNTPQNTVVFSVNSAPSGQTVTFADSTPDFKYNVDTLASGSYKFLKSESAIAVTINPLDNYTVTYAPAVITPSVSAFSATFTAPVVPSNGNPFAGAHQYVNPDYQGEVGAFLTNNPSYATKAKPYLNTSGQWDTSTAVWIDRESAINGYVNSSNTTIHGISWHMAQALAQATSNTPTVITFVVYDLPDRDCAAYSSNGEIQLYGQESLVQSGLNQYENNYINPLSSAISNFYSANPGAVSKVKVVLLIEPDSLPNMITNAGVNGGSSAYPTCTFVNQNRVYVQGIAYALNQFTSSPYASSLYLYLDIAHSGWMGWATNANQISLIYNDKAPTDTSTPYGGLGSGFDKIRGFVVNTANYTPVTEAFSYSQYLNNNAIISSSFYQWNDVYSLDSYIAEIMSLGSNGQLTQANGHQIVAPTTALYQNMHFVIDTSRNNWATSTYTANGTSYSRHDLRDSNANWCNVQNISLNGSMVSSGLGLVPQSNPVLNNPLYTASNGTAIPLPVDAYIWVKPPGESDGNYNQATGLGDLMCGTGNGGFHNGSLPTDSLQNGSSPAPDAGGWFSDAFALLLNNS